MRIIEFATLFSLVVLMAAATLPAGEIHEAARGGDVARVRELLAQDSSLLNSFDDQHNTALYIAAANGHLELASMLLDSGADITIGDNENSQPIHLAAIGGYREIVDLLLARGARVNDADDNGMTPLLFALSRGQFDMARYLIDLGADVKATSRSGWSALLSAAIGGDSAFVEYVIEKGARVNTRLENGVTPLHSAASYGRTGTVKALVNHGVNVNTGDERGQTPLFYTKNANCAEVVRFLIEHGADVRHRDQINTTPLHSVAERGTISIARILLENGADINAVDNFGRTPLTLAVYSSIDLVRFLILNGAEVNPPPPLSIDTSAAPHRYMRPLHLCGQTGGADIARVLVENGAEINVLDESGFTPLHSAIRFGNADLVSYLVSKGAFVNVPEDNLGRTELHTAAVRGYRDIVDLLIEHGADATLTDDFGRTPSEYACYLGYQQTAHALSASGGDDAHFALAASEPSPLQRELSNGEAVVWYLGHSGWAVKTKNHFLIFDYSLDTRLPVPAEASLAGGHIIPAELADYPLSVFASHSHGDHYNDTIFTWRQGIANIDYYLGFRPRGIEEEYTYLPPHRDHTAGDMTITTISSTDEGVGFLVDVDGVVILHSGDHANGAANLDPAFTSEIDYLAETGKTIDLAFLGITGCGLPDEQLVKQGVRYAVDKLQPKVLFPMHGGWAAHRYQQFADEATGMTGRTRICCAFNEGDRFIYSPGGLLDTREDQLQTR